MASSTIKRLPSVTADSDLAVIGAAVNRLAVRLDALLAKLDADAGVTDTNYAATINGTGDNSFIKIQGLDTDPFDPAPLT